MATVPRFYKPGQPPTFKEGLGRELADYLNRELNLVSKNFTDFPHIHFQTKHVAPEKPRMGDVVYADGDDWNPGYGEGPYFYSSLGLWTPCGAEMVASQRNYYVRTDGSDSNDGLSNDASGAWLTLQKAANVIRNLYIPGGIQVYVLVADGTYTGGVTVYGWNGSGQVVFQGNTTTPANCHLNVNGNIFVCDAVRNIYIQGFKMSAGIGTCVYFFNSRGYLGNVEFGVSAYHMILDHQSYLNPQVNYSITGGAAGWHILCQQSWWIMNSLTVTLTGTPAFGGYALSQFNGTLYSLGMTFSGAATGQRFQASMNGIVFVNGAGINYFPGNVAGATATGGQYV